MIVVGIVLALLVNLTSVEASATLDAAQTLLKMYEMRPVGLNVGGIGRELHQVSNLLSYRGGGKRSIQLDHAKKLFKVAPKNFKINNAHIAKALFKPIDDPNKQRNRMRKPRGKLGGPDNQLVLFSREQSFLSCAANLGKAIKEKIDELDPTDREDVLALHENFEHYKGTPEEKMTSMDNSCKLIDGQLSAFFKHINDCKGIDEIPDEVKQWLELSGICSEMLLATKAELNKAEAEVPKPKLKIEEINDANV